jgi:hypothetical protein
VQELQEAALQLLLAHCHVPALELSGVLDACLNPTGFKQLQPFLQAMLLQQLGPVLAALPVNRAARALQTLPQLVQEVTATTATQQQQIHSSSLQYTPSSNASSEAKLLLSLSAWAGVAQLCQAAADKAPPMLPAHKPLTAALQGAVSALARQLPLLPAVTTPGQLIDLVQQSQQDAAAQLASQVLEQQQQQQQQWLAKPSSSSSSSSSEVGDVLLVWKAALSCCRLLNPDLLLAMTAVQPHSAAAAAAARPGVSSQQQQQQQVLAMQLRSLLVLAGKISWKELPDAKHAFVGMPSSAAPAPAAAAAAGTSGVLTQHVLLPLALGCATAPQAGLLQQLQELPALAAAAAVSPDNAALLAAAMITAWQAGLGSSSSSDASVGGSAATAAATAAAAAVDAQLTLTVPQLTQLQQLPAVLPQLLSCSKVMGSKQGFAEAVCRVLLDVRAQPRLNPGLGLRLAAAVCAVREQLPSSGSSCWQELMVQTAQQL